MPDSSRPPVDDVRAAFERLATPEKVAFVLEATFDTIGQAIGETGRAVSDAVSSLDFDSLFRPAPPSSGPPPPPDGEPPFAPPTSRPKRSGPRRPSPGPSPTDDGPPAV